MLDNRQGFLTFSAFASVVILGGLNGIGVRFTVLELAPFWGAVLRFVPTTLVFFLLVFAFRLPLPRGRSLLGACVYGFLSIGMSYAFIYWGLQKIPASMAMLFLALVPLMTLLFAVAHHQEALHWRAIFGALLAVGGIVLVFGLQLGSNVPIASLVALLLGTACMAESSVIIKGFPQSHPVSTNAIATATGCVLLMIMSFLGQETHVLPSMPRTWIALVYLVIGGSCILFVLFLYVLKRWTASATSYAFILMPFVTVVAAALLAQETISVIFLLGGILVIAGVYIGALRPAVGKKPMQQIVNVEAMPTPGCD